MGTTKKLTILHSNDLHGDFVAESVDTGLVGGVSYLSGYVGKVREEEENAIYCIAGDMFRGSVIDSEFHGISTIEIMNMISPDVVAIGNHETDYGLAHLLFVEKCAKFPIINANLHINTNGARLFKPYHIIEIGGMKILFIGIITEEVLSQTKSEGLIGSFVDIEEAATEVGRICNTYNALDIDLTVLLTHIGFEEDKKLAALLDKTWGVDLIIGGHSHTLPEEPAVVNGIPIVQAGTGTDQIGRFDIEIDTEKNCIHSYKWQIVPIDDAHCPKDENIEKILLHYKGHTDKKYSRLVTRLTKKLTHPTRYRETELGNLFSDIIRDSLGLDVMLLGSGSIRKEELGPIVQYSDLSECFPYDDPIHMFRVTGKQFKEMIRFMLRDEAFNGEHTEFYQFSDGLKVVYNRQTHDFKEFAFNGTPIDEVAELRVGMQDFHFKNLESFLNIPLAEAKKNGKPRVVATSCREILDEYMSAKQNLDSRIYDRLIIE
ncbi:MAG: bifunctional metallophosphatase/5'-nucleotidase [Clostridia bacterium]|nr:bifunctional metallophosphatase/5'-nucleotidase [Clostridia bacterium]